MSDFQVRTGRISLHETPFSPFFCPVLTAVSVCASLCRVFVVVVRRGEIVHKSPRPNGQLIIYKRIGLETHLT